MRLIDDQMQWLAAAHLATSMAGWLPLPGRQNYQHDCLVPHFFSQSWRAGTHLGSFWQAAHWLGHFYWMHCWGSAKTNPVYSLALSQLLAWAHLATSMAAWLPLLGRQTAQQEALVPHFLLQSSRAGMHLGSFWQAAHWAGHFSSIHFWGSATTKAVLFSA